VGEVPAVGRDLRQRLDRVAEQHLARNQRGQLRPCHRRNEQTERGRQQQQWSHEESSVTGNRGHSGNDTLRREGAVTTLTADVWGKLSLSLPAGEQRSALRWRPHATSSLAAPRSLSATLLPPDG